MRVYFCRKRKVYRPLEVSWWNTATIESANKLKLRLEIKPSSRQCRHTWRGNFLPWAASLY
jgi:hypothetical protein